MLKSWVVVNLNWFEKAQVVKTKIFPKFLFLFCGLTLTFSSQMLAKWQAMLTKFVWHYKRPRVRLVTMCKSKAQGSLALPDLQRYNDAVSLPKILKHYSSSYQADLKFIEDADFFSKGFEKVLWTHPRGKPRHMGYMLYCWPPFQSGTGGALSWSSQIRF